MLTFYLYNKHIFFHNFCITTLINIRFCFISLKSLSVGTDPENQSIDGIVLSPGGN